MSIAGVFLIQRLEGSRCGTVVLWVLNAEECGECRGIKDKSARNGDDHRANDPGETVFGSV